MSKKKDWLTKNERLRIAELAIMWLQDEPVDTERFGLATVVIEGYVAHGPFEVLDRLKREAKKGNIVQLKAIK